MFTRTLLLGAFAALAAAQSAVLTFTRVPNPITDGQPQALLYATNDTSSPVTIVLRQGPANNLQTVETLTTDATGGQYIWTPPLSLPNGNNYALEIRQDGQVNYFGPFTVQGASPSAVASASASATSSMTGSMTSAYGSVTTTTMASNATTNGTMTMTGMTSAGTGTTMSRNSTMSSATLSNTRTATMTSASTDGAGFQGTQTGGSEPSQTGNAAVASFEGKSTVAFVLGALAAVLYVQ